MSDLEVLLDRINAAQAEREANGGRWYSEAGDPASNKGKWKDSGFDAGLNWVENEILALLASASAKQSN
jgi:hypothetical protein